MAESNGAPESRVIHDEEVPGLSTSITKHMYENETEKVVGYCVGLDLGGHSSVVASVDPQAPHCVAIEVNKVANRSTPSVISFNGKVRNVGEEAEARILADPENTIAILPCLMEAENSNDINALYERFRFLQRGRYVDDGQVLQVSVEFAGRSLLVPLEIPLCHYLRQLVSFGRINRSTMTTTAEPPAKVAIAVPNNYSPILVSRIVTASDIVGIRPVLLSRADALLNCWCCRHLPNFYDEHRESNPNGTSAVLVGLLDVGYTETSIQIFALKAEDGGRIKPEILARTANGQLGVCDAITRLTEEVVEIVKAKYNEAVVPHSKQGARLFAACSRAVTHLSGLTDSSIDVEGFLCGEGDLHIAVTRAKFEDLCSPLQEKLKEMLSSTLAMANAKPSEIAGVDVVGGGSRIPWVAATVDAALSPTNGLRHTLDGASSVSMGAASFAGGIRFVESIELCDTHTVGEERMQALRAVDSSMSAVEDEELLRQAQRNQLEAYLLEMQGAMRGPHKEHLAENGTEIESFLKETEHWLLDHEDASLAKYEETFSHVKKTLHSKCPKYFEALEEARKKREQEISDGAAATRSTTVEDMDVKLRKPQCISRAKKNKDEGNELFKHGSTEMAVQHYVKALQYLAKIFDMSEDENKEVSPLKLSLHLNLAQAYLKLSGQDPRNPVYEMFSRKAISCCDAAVEIDPDNLKALFRRSIANEKLRNYEPALVDVKTALKLKPADPDFEKLRERLEKRLKQEREQQKKMYAKMFV